jgi:hypothetical protein
MPAGRLETPLHLTSTDALWEKSGHPFYIEKQLVKVSFLSVYVIKRL